MAEGDTVTRKANDVGVPMVEGSPDEPIGPEDAAGLGVKRGDYSDRGDGKQHFQMVRDADGDIVAQDQNALMEQTPGVPEDGTKGGVNSGGGAAGVGTQNTKYQFATTGTVTAGTATVVDQAGNDYTINWDDTAAEIAATFEAQDTFDSGDITPSGGPLPGTPVVLEFAGDFAETDEVELTLTDDVLTGGTLTLEKTQSGGVGPG